MHSVMHTCDVLVLGSGHLAYRIGKLAVKRGLEMIQIHASDFEPDRHSGSAYESILATIRQIDLSSVSMIYVVDESDDFNLEVLIAIFTLSNDVPVTAALFNEKLAPHLREAHPRLYILNPAKIAAPAFVNALFENTETHLHYHPESVIEKVKTPGDKFLQYLLISFLILVAGSTMYFHYADGLSWLDALYFVMVTVTTVGYGDINLKDSSASSKIAGIILILISTVFIWIIFSLLIDRVIKKRIQYSLGRKKYNLKDHVILCGLGRLGYFIAEELLRRKEKAIIVEADENNRNLPYFRSLGADIYIGDARLPRVLQDVSAGHAKALISVIDNDYGNLEIGLNARSFNPELKIILRFFDDAMSAAIKKRLDVHFTISMSAIADEAFLDTMGEKVKSQK